MNAACPSQFNSKTNVFMRVPLASARKKLILKRRLEKLYAPFSSGVTPFFLCVSFFDCYCNIECCRVVRRDFIVKQRFWRRDPAPSARKKLNLKRLLERWYAPFSSGVTHVFACHF